MFAPHASWTRPFQLVLALLVSSGSAAAQGALAVDLRPGEPASATRLFGPVHQALPVLPATTESSTPADLDGDGHVDLLVGVSDVERVFVLLGNEDGSFLDRVSSVAVNGEPGTIAVGDVDGDGDQDVFAAGGTLLLNDGSARFFDASANLAHPAPGMCFLRDVELDGDLDIVSWGNQSAHSQLRNDGQGVFADANASMPALLFAYLDIDMADVDGDGDDDALTGPSHAQPARLFLDQGGTYVDATARLTPVVGGAEVNVPAVHLVDLDGDGDRDALLHRRYGFGQLTELQLNDGLGTFTAVPSPVPITVSQRLEVGDVDGDGDLDIVRDEVRWNQGSLQFSQGPPASFGDPFNGPNHAVTLVDVDGDGDLDALPRRGIGELYLFDGSGNWTSVGRSALPVRRGTELTLGDVDGDQAPDLFAVDGGVRHLLRNDGSGGFEDVTSTRLPPLVAGGDGLALGDLVEDGALDAMMGGVPTDSGVDRPYTLLRNLGDGSFDAPPVNHLGLSTSVALGDVDGDGHLDAVLGGSTFEPDRLLLGDGAGTFLDASADFPQSATYTNVVVLGDVDGDGDLDAVLANTSAPHELCTNDGTGFFTLSSGLPADAASPLDALLADLEGDGDLDLVVASGSGFQDRVYRNDGSGAFEDVSATLPQSDLGAQVSAADVDGDGLLDLLSLGTLWLGDASGGFRDASYELAPYRIFERNVLGDVDGDGDPDIVGTPFLANLRRQVGWRSQPRVGRDLTIECNGSPGALWWILGAPSPGRATLPLYGTFLLHGTESIYLASGSLGPRGTARMTFSPPQLPGLAVEPLYLQAVVGTPLLFSNLEIAVFTD